MASPFQKYQGEQVQQIAPGFVEAYGRAGQSIGAGIASLAENVTKGYLAGEQRRQEEIKTKAALAPFIKNDERTKRAEDLTKLGVFTKTEDGTLTLSASYADKVNIKEANDLLGFYNSTGGDGSKLSGDALNEFAARYEGEQKYVAQQAANAKAKLEGDLTRAKIADLNSKAAERVATAGAYGAALSGLGFAVTPTATIGADGEPVLAAPSAAYTAPGVSLPEVKAPEPTAPFSPAYTAPSASEPSPAAPAAAPAEPAPAPAKPRSYTNADFDSRGYLKAPASATPTKPVAAPVTPAAPAPAAAPAVAAPAAPAERIDLAAEAKRVAEQRATYEKEKETVRANFAKQRTATETQLARIKSIPLAPRKTGLDIAQITLAHHQERLKGINDAEQRELAAIDDKIKAVDTQFSQRQAAATAGRLEDAARLAREKETREIKEAQTKAATEAEKAATESSKAYPKVGGPWVHKGFNIAMEGKNPSRYGIRPLNEAQSNEVSDTVSGYNTAANFLVTLEDTLTKRDELVAGGSDYKERFRLTAQDMLNYYTAEMASVFGVATFRKAIVSGGNFSDADREFVKSVITYLNTAAPDLSAEDLRDSMMALGTFINAMYARKLESYDMAYNPETARNMAAKLKADGYESEANQEYDQIESFDKFYSKFGIKTKDGKIASRGPEFAAAVESARQTLWNRLPEKMRKGLEGSRPGIKRPAASER